MATKKVNSLYMYLWYQPMMKRSVATLFASNNLLVALVAASVFDAPTWDGISAPVSGRLISAISSGPSLYKTPYYQSPVRAEPDDLIMIPGFGFSADDVVVYRALTDTNSEVTPPDLGVDKSTSESGRARIVSTNNIPYSVTALLPREARKDQSYAIWVCKKSRSCSQPISINDARPLWLSPEIGYTSDLSPGLESRYLKIVGRNLQPATGGQTWVRLSSPTATWVIAAENDNDPSTAIEHYVAKVTLPHAMPPGSYDVAVSRDGTSWVPLAEQNFFVRADPSPPPMFKVTDHGSCQPNDDDDDTACIIAAIAAARNAGGGSVVFGPGTWKMQDSVTSGVNRYPDYGVVVPIGVNLIGAGADKTTLARGPNWRTSGLFDWRDSSANFTLMGSNIVQGFTFTDLHLYTLADKSMVTYPSFLRLGREPRYVQPNDPLVIDNVTITKNIFHNPYIAINAFVPLDHLTITHNVIGAYKDGVLMRADITSPIKFEIKHSIINSNIFQPGSYIDLEAQQGAVASHLDGVRWGDFSGNFADGASLDALQHADDPKGFRAAFFWDNTSENEMLLVSQNTIRCSGDKDGDGEAIAYDGGYQVLFDAPREVANAGRSHVQVSGNLPTQSYGYTLPANYFDNTNRHTWIRVVSGPGIGQMRRVTSIARDDASIRFAVAPEWDVTPLTSSKVQLGQPYWHVYTVDNFITNASPPCSKSNRTKPSAGALYMAGGPSADSTFEGNRNYDSNGIFLNVRYTASPHPEKRWADVAQYFTEVRGNTLEGEYDWGAERSWSGIMLWNNVPRRGTTWMPTNGYGITISHNRITHADALYNAGISLAVAWELGPQENNDKFINNTLIFHNVLQHIAGAPVSDFGHGLSGATRTGINITDKHILNTVLYGNTFDDVSQKLIDHGVGTVVLESGRSP